MLFADMPNDSGCWASQGDYNRVITHPDWNRTVNCECQHVHVTSDVITLV